MLYHLHVSNNDVHESKKNIMYLFLIFESLHSYIINAHQLLLTSLFVSAGLAYKPWLKVLLTGLVWEENTVDWLISQIEAAEQAERCKVILYKISFGIASGSSA